MKLNRRFFFAATALAIIITADSSGAAPKFSWDGTWNGAWGGTASTSITVAGNKVVRYTYKGNPVPVGASKVSGNTVSFGTTYKVTMTRISDTSASAQYHGPQGDAAGDLTKQ
jgi:hypothetical protein